MKKQEILNALDELGFSVEELNENFYVFEYDEVKYWYTYYEDDDEYLHLSIPGIFHISDDDADMVMPAINRANDIFKYAKITYSQELVWATFEYHLFEWVDVEELIEFAIKVLHSAALTFNRVLHGEFDNNEEEEEVQQ